MNVSREPLAAHDRIGRLGQEGVPVIDMGGRIAAGLDRPKIDGNVEENRIWIFGPRIFANDHELVFLFVSIRED